MYTGCLSTEMQEMCNCPHQILKIRVGIEIKISIMSVARKVPHIETTATYPSKQLLFLFIHPCHSSLISLQEFG